MRQRTAPARATPTRARHIRPRAALAATLVAVLAVAADARDLEGELAALDRLDESRVALELRDQPLVRVLDEVQAATAVPLAADWHALAGLGIDERTPATLVVRDVSAFVALRALAIQLGDELGRPTVEVSAGRLLLTSRDAAAALRWTEVYDVRDLLDDPRVAAQLEPAPVAPPPVVPAPPTDRTDDDETDADSAPALDPELLSDDAPPPAPPTPGEALVQVLLDHVDPEAWVRYGGTQARVDERNGVLLVSAPPTIHRALRDALGRLRRANPSSLEFVAAIVDVPRSAFAALERRAAGGGERLARLLLALPADAGAAVHWRSSGLAGMDMRYETRAESGDARCTLALEPSFDAERGVVALQVALAQDRDEDRRHVDTGILLAGERSGFVLELPAATIGDTVRLLAVTTTRR